MLGDKLVSVFYCPACESHHIHLIREGRLVFGTELQAGGRLAPTIPNEMDLRNWYARKLSILRAIKPR